jgi:hypothetical protein
MYYKIIPTTRFLCAPDQKPIRTIFPGFYTCWILCHCRWSPQGLKLGFYCSYMTSLYCVLFFKTGARATHGQSERRELYCLIYMLNISEWKEYDFKVKHSLSFIRQLQHHLGEQRQVLAFKHKGTCCHVSYNKCMN